MKKKLLLFLLFAPITTVLAQITTVNARFITSVGCEIGVDDEMSSNNVFEKDCFLVHISLLSNIMVKWLNVRR